MILADSVSWDSPSVILRVLQHSMLEVLLRRPHDDVSGILKGSRSLRHFFATCSACRRDWSRAIVIVELEFSPDHLHVLQTSNRVRSCGPLLSCPQTKPHKHQSEDRWVPPQHQPPQTPKQPAWAG